MIQTETLTFNGKEFTRTYSDSGCYVVRDGISYGEAIDPVGTGRTYTEGEKMPVDENTLLQEKAEAYDILMGGAE